ncbi:OmpA family protein [Dyella agri]|uniref:OmpA family protein n=1 Tax=Dyella agri TaxID=1926869 RepID=A0ABW8KK46_9GAMM
MKRRAGVCAVALMAALLVDGCGMVQRHAAADDAASTEVGFPDPSRASLPEGSYVNLENLRKVGPGMSKAQLYALLGAPHFNEGVFGVREWNYIFDFRKADGSGEHFSCQYQVDFDKHHLAAGFHWKPASCESVLEPPRPAPTPAPVAMPSQPIRLSSDALFAFDRSTLTPQGRGKLSDLLAQVQSASQIEDIMIVGYTDRIGSDRYNLALSQRRAEAVRDYLAAQGVPANAMRTEGRGKSDPLARCSNRNRAALIACLAPNRRVELSGVVRRS